MRNGDAPRLGRMLQLDVAALLSHGPPPIRCERRENITALHQCVSIHTLNGASNLWFQSNDYKDLDGSRPAGSASPAAEQAGAEAHDRQRGEREAPGEGDPAGEKANHAGDDQ